MRTTAKNPFEVLGLHLSIVRETSPENLRALLKSQYRALQLIYHADRNPGDAVAAQKSCEINDNYSLLEDADAFEHFRAEFTKQSPRNQTKKLEERIRQLMKEQDGSSKSFLDFLIKLQNRKSLTVFNFAPCELMMYDHGLFFSRNNYVNTVLDPDSLFYSMRIAEDGTITKKRNNGEFRYTDRVIIGAISQKTENEHDGIKNIMRRMSDFITPTEYSLARKGLLPGKSRNVELREYEEKINPEAFKTVLHLLTPEISTLSYLFSMTTLQDSCYFSLEGRVSEIKS